MANKKSKKRTHSRTADLKRQMEQEKLAGEKQRAKNRMDPAARTLLLLDLVFLAAASLLEANGLIGAAASAMLTVIGVVLLLWALWLQFGKKKNGPGKGPRL